MHPVELRERDALVLVDLQNDFLPGEPLLVKVMEGGRRLTPGDSWRRIRERVQSRLETYPEAFLSLTEQIEAPVVVSDQLKSIMI